jgi:hypothetical protein
VPSLKDLRSKDQKARGLRRIDGHEETDYYRRHNVPVSYQTWVEMKWVCLSYSMSLSSLLNQVLSWAYHCHYADGTISHRLGNPYTLSARHREFASVNFNWPPELVARAGALFTRCSQRIANPWPADRDRMACVLEGAWDEYRKRNPRLAVVEAGVPQEFDPNTLCFIKTTYDPMTRAKKVERIRPPEDDDAVEEG